MNTELVMPQVPTAPDLSRLPEISFDTMFVTVTDQPSAELAISCRNAADDYMKNVEAIFDEPTKAANLVHKFFTGLKAKMIGKAAAVKLHNNTQLMAFQRTQELATAKLQADLQRKAYDQAKRERDAELADAMLFGGDVEVLKEAPLEVVTVRLGTPKVEGISTANKPWSYEVIDLKSLLQAIVEGKADIEAIQINGPFMTQQARYYKGDLSARFPGVNGVQEKRIKR